MAIEYVPTRLTRAELLG